jgi:hypothetical protein
MSAAMVSIGWRFDRALAALRTGRDVDFTKYSKIFEIDEARTIVIFMDAACSLGVCLEVRADPVLH